MKKKHHNNVPYRQPGHEASGQEISTDSASVAPTHRLSQNINIHIR